jgi:hypothetical protein
MAKRHFFISRAGEDAEYAKWVAAILEDAGFTTILQDLDFQAGGSFIHLAMARLHHSREHFLKAEALIAATGYHRRDAELEALRQSL